jgi:hypothetical protein
MAISTPWVEYPGQYSAACHTEGGATWLQVSPVKVNGDRRPRVPEIGGPSWGFHAADVNLALGNLVQDVRLQVAAYLAAHPGHA